MHISTITINVVLVFSFHHSFAENVDEFRAAMVEYKSRCVETSVIETMIVNLQRIVVISEELKSRYSDLKIIIFPEHSLISPDWYLKQNRLLLRGEMIPDKNEHVSLCENSFSISEIIKTLACIARNNSIYFVTNILEKTETDSTEGLYNTNIVFSPTGALIAKTDEPEIVYFDTNFGVRFGTFICFDIVHRSPAQDLVNGDYGVKHIVFPTGWFQVLPFDTALQHQAEWSYGTNTILLAAGLNYHPFSSTGTGVHFGQLDVDDDDDIFEKKFLQNQISGDFAVISYIPKSLDITNFNSRSEIHYFYDTKNAEKIKLTFEKENLDIYTIEPLDELEDIDSVTEGNENLTFSGKTLVNRTVCNRGLCCEFSFTITTLYCLDVSMPRSDEIVGDKFGQFKYHLAAFNGVRNVVDKTRTVGIQSCSILSCLNEDKDSCGKHTEEGVPEFKTINGEIYHQCYTKLDDVIIKSKFITKNSFVTANILLSSSRRVGNDPMPTNKGFFRFGMSPHPKSYTVSVEGDFLDQTATYVFKSLRSLINPGTICLYNRLYDLDGQPESINSVRFNIDDYYLKSFLLIFTLLVIFICKHFTR